MLPNEWEPTPVRENAQVTSKAQESTPQPCEAIEAQATPRGLTEMLISNASAKSCKKLVMVQIRMAGTPNVFLNKCILKQ